MKSSIVSVVFAAVFLLLVVPQAAIAADYFQLISHQNQSRCIGKSAADPAKVKTLPCTDANTKFKTSEFASCSYVWGSGQVCVGRLQYYGTNTCIVANSSSTVTNAICNTSQAQKWRHTSATDNIANFMFGPTIVMYYDTVNNLIQLNNTLYNHPTRMFFLRYW